MRLSVMPGPQRFLEFRPVFIEECVRAGVPYVDLQPIVQGHEAECPYFDPLHPDAPTVRRLVDQGVLPFFLAQTAARDSLH